MHSTATRMSHMPLIRPAWTPATTALMVGGFIVFWPLGLAMLAYILWGDRFDAWRNGQGSLRDAMGADFRSGWGRSCRSTGARGFTASPRTGNVAFDDWREKELERLAEERRKLDAMRDEFDAYARELRRAKDQEEFDRFMRQRDAASGETGAKGRTSKKPGPDVIED